MNSAEKTAQRGIAGAGRPVTSEVPAGAVDVVPVRALLLGDRLDTRTLEPGKPLGVGPLIVDVAGGGSAVLFRYAAVVLFGTSAAAAEHFVGSLMASVNWTAREGSADRDRRGTPRRAGVAKHDLSSSVAAEPAVIDCR